MTLDTAIQQAWEALGEPSDLNPSKVGIARLRDAANDAQDMIAMYRDQRGRKLFFRELEDVLPFQSLMLAGTLETQGSTRVISLPNMVAPVYGRFEGWVIEVGDEVRKVVTSGISVGVNTLVLASDLSDTCLTETLPYVLSKVDYQFTGLDAIDTNGARVVEVQRVFDPETGGMLEEVGTRDYLYGSGMGVPGSWRHSNTGVQFDVAPESERVYQMHVTRLPTKVDQLTDEFELPEAFCQAIVMRMEWWGFRRMQDFQAAYACKMEFNEMLATLATSAQLNETPDYFTVRSR